MAWPFGGGASRGNPEHQLTEDRLRMMANIAIEQVPLPEDGILGEEDAWTISAGPTKARVDGYAGVPTASGGGGAVSAAPANVLATVDTAPLERLLSSRLDMVEDVLRMVEEKLESGVTVSTGDGGEAIEGEENEAGEDDMIVTSTGEVIPAGAGGVARAREEDEAPLLELYEAQALAANPFLSGPSFGDLEREGGVGAPTVAALLLDNLSGMAAVSFAQKATESGMLTPEEGRGVLSIVQLASPGEADAALEDHLSHNDLLTFSALVGAWRKVSTRGGVE